jgi:precorrin-2/cobalt-factor-2 C20-methyltransferase
VGVGPGDAELMTLKALRVLKACSVIAVPDSGRDGEGLAESIVKQALGKDLGQKEFLRLKLPMTKDVNELRKARKLAAKNIVKRLEDGTDVAFVTIGDPLFYSTFSPLVPYVKDACPKAVVSVVPGVMSVSATAAALLTPLSEASEKVAIIPATYGVEEVRDAIEEFDVVVLMKVNRSLDRILGLLDEFGLSDSAAFVSKASWPDEEVVRDVRKLRGETPGYFSMMVIRKKEGAEK